MGDNSSPSPRQSPSSRPAAHGGRLPVSWHETGGRPPWATGQQATSRHDSCSQEPAMPAPQMPGHRQWTSPTYRSRAPLTPRCKCRRVVAPPLAPGVRNFSASLSQVPEIRHHRSTWGQFRQNCPHVDLWWRISGTSSFTSNNSTTKCPFLSSYVVRINAGVPKHVGTELVMTPTRYDPPSPGVDTLSTSSVPILGDNMFTRTTYLLHTVDTGLVFSREPKVWELPTRCTPLGCRHLGKRTRVA